MKRFFLVILFFLSTSLALAVGPEKSGIIVPEYFIENFQCLTNCEGISFQDKEKVYFDATDCPTCVTYHLEYGNPNFGNDPNEFRFFKVTEDAFIPEAFSFVKTDQCKIEFDSRGKHFEISFKSCGREVEKINCSGACENIRIYESWPSFPQDKLKYNSCGSFDLCKRYFLKKEFRIEPDYGYEPGTPYTLYFRDWSGDINTILEQRPRARERSYHLMQLPVLDLKSAQKIQTDVQGTTISFDLKTRDGINYWSLDPGGIVVRIFLGIFLVTSIVFLALRKFSQK